MLGPIASFQSQQSLAARIAVCLAVALLLGAGTAYITHLSVGEEINRRLQTQLENIIQDFPVELLQNDRELTRFLSRTARVNRMEYCAFLDPDGKVIARSGIEAGPIGNTWREPISTDRWSGTITRTHRVEKREGAVKLGSIVVATEEPTFVGTATRITKKYSRYIAVGFLTVFLGLLYTLSSTRPLVDIDHQLSRAALSPTVSDLPFHTVPQRTGAAAGWNRIVERLNQQTEVGSVEQRLQAAVDSVQQTKSDFVLNSLTDGILVADQGGSIAFANRAAYALLGLVSEDQSLVTRGAVEVIQQFLDVGEESAINDQGAHSRSVVEELSRNVPGVGEQIVRVARHPLISTESGEQIGTVWTLRDITQQTLAKRMRDQFLDSATHELRTPLANIRAYAETLASSDIADVEQQKMFCNTINTEATRLARFIDDLLSISSFEMGSLSLSLQQVDVDRMLRAATKKVQAQVDQKGIRFVQTLPEKLPYLRLDKDKFTAAIVNLLGNAIKYTPSGGQVELRVTVKKNVFRIDVADSGVGISEQDLPRVFDKFFRSTDPRIQDIEGTGLGLSLSQEIIRLHGGELTVTSKLDKGSIFTITLPC